MSRYRVRSEIQSINLNIKSNRISNREVDQLSNVGHVVISAKPFQFETQLYMLEGNKVVIKMIIKDRSPTMRHVSRSHRVALDWLFDKINLVRKIRIKSVDLQSNSLSYWLKIISHVMSGVIFFVCSTSWISRCFRTSKSETSCRRELRREESGEERVLAKSRSVRLNSSSLSANQSPILDSDTSHSPGNCRLGWNSDLTSSEKSRRDRSENPASSSQVWHRDDNPFSRFREIDTRDESAFKYRETGTWSTESSDGDKVEKTQPRDLQYSKHWESLRKCSTKVESSRRRRDSAGPNSRCIDLVILYVNNNEKKRYILEIITMRTSSPTGTPTSRRQRRCSISLINWSWIRSTRSSTSPRLNNNLFLGWDLRCYMTK